MSTVNDDAFMLMRLVFFYDTIILTTLNNSRTFPISSELYTIFFYGILSSAVLNRCGRTGYTGPTGRTGPRHDPPDPSAYSTHTALPRLAS